MVEAILKYFAEIKAGYPFRGSVPEAEDGSTSVVQMRDIDPVHGVKWESAARTHLEGRREPDWLAPGDIVFVARGLRNYAVCLDEVPVPAVCSQYFYLLRVKNHEQLLPQFLAWQINRAPAQRYLGKNAEGSDQLSIRRTVLEELPLAVPPLDRQHRIIELHKHALAERAILENLIRNRERQLDALASDLFVNQSNRNNHP
ncbi:MAG TPA: restriction endonuclease subunit S [Noviherbaspirillum sp.]